MTEKSWEERLETGTKVRRRILGDSHVDRAETSRNVLNSEFLDLLTRYGWAEIWGRDGLDYRTRRILVLGTMMALGRWEEFTMHLRAALRDNFSLEDIKEVMLQQAIYCGLPVSNTAFRHLASVVDEMTAEGVALNWGALKPSAGG